MAPTAQFKFMIKLEQRKIINWNRISSYKPWNTEQIVIKMWLEITWEVINVN